MSDLMKYVTYYVVSLPQKGSKEFKQFNALNSLDARGDHILQEFQHNNPSAQFVSSVVEYAENRRSTKWPKLQKALELCKQHSASLLILELGNLANHESFTQTLLHAKVPFQCIDQPFVNQPILEALSKHAEVQRKLHGKLIREGLKMTSAKSGNPNAAEVIGKVNKPKIDTAIVFAFLLSPLIKNYRGKKYSQRQMVKALNDEGFTAPEGGKWVLSQLQKVLDRVRLNDTALSVEPTLKAHLKNQKNPIEIADLLNQSQVPALKTSGWDETQVKKVIDRLEHIQEISLINQFVIDILPLLRSFQKQELSPEKILEIFEQARVPVRQPMTV